MKFELRAIDDSNKDEVELLEVYDNQKQYIASNKDSILTSLNEEHRDVARPFAIYADGNLIGFTMFAFDLASSNLALRVAFPALVYNLVKYSLCPPLDAASFVAGEEITLNKVNGAVLTSVAADVPEAAVQHYARLPERIVADIPGAYVVSSVMSDETVQTTRYFVKLPPEESNLTRSGKPLPEFDYAETKVSYEQEITRWFVMLLLLLIVVEWGVQYREQF